MRVFRGFSIALAGLAATVAVNQASAAMLAADLATATAALKEYNLITFGNVSSNSEVEGRSFIGGDLTGNSSNYYTSSANVKDNTPGLTVVGNVTGDAKNLNNGSGASVGGNLASQNGFNLNGANQTVNIGGTSTQQNINQNTVNANLGANFTATLTSQKNSLISTLGSLSSNLQALAATGTDSIANNTLTINGTSTSSLNVFNISSADLDAVNQLSISNATGATTVINVSGTSINLNDNFLSASSTLGNNVIWNFYQATSLNVSNAFYGSVLAPQAAATLSNFVQGSLVVSSLTQQGEVHIANFQGDLSSLAGTVSAAPEPATWAMMILGFGVIGAMLRRRPRLVEALVRA